MVYVDISAVTTTAQTLANLNFNSALTSALLALIAVLKSIQIFFPHIGGK